MIPAYNEEQRLPATLLTIFEYLEKHHSSTEVIVVDDGSTDATVEVAERFGNRCGLRVLRNPGNRGKGYAVRNGMLAAQGEWVLFTDADLSSPIAELQKLQNEAKRTDAVIAIGSRALDRSLVQVHQSGFRESSGRIFNLIMRLVTGLPFLDTQCGFKLYRLDAAKEVFSRQRLNGFSFDVEDLVIAQRLGLRSIEVPVRWSNVLGTKVSLMNGLQSFSDLLLIRWNDLRGRYS